MLRCENEKGIAFGISFDPMRGRAGRCIGSEFMPGFMLEWIDRTSRGDVEFAGGVPPPEVSEGMALDLHARVVVVMGDGCVAPSKTPDAFRESHMKSLGVHVRYEFGKSIVSHSLLRYAGFVADNLFDNFEVSLVYDAPLWRSLFIPFTNAEESIFDVGDAIMVEVKEEIHPTAGALDKITGSLMERPPGSPRPFSPVQRHVFCCMCPFQH